MNVDFRKIEFDYFDQIEKPTVILAQPDKTLIGSIGNIYNLDITIRYSNISEISFTMPSKIIDQYTNKYVRTPYYDDVKGEKLVEIYPWGWFKLKKPTISTDGIKEIKECTALSLETEFNQKYINGLDGTFKFYDAVTPQNSLLGIIMSLIPSWSVGQVDADLWYKYRTFKINEQSLYNFMMNDMQKTYQCIFEFDTYNKQVHVKALSNIGKKSLVYMSLDNLIKNIEIEEKSDEMVNYLKVYGASGVDIRRVNPTGEVGIWNFDYFANIEWMDINLANKLKAYDALINANQAQYASLRTQYRTRNGALLALNSKLVDLQNDLMVIDNIRNVRIQKGLTYADLNVQTAQKNTEIAVQQGLINAVNLDIDSIENQILAINTLLKFENNFTKTEIVKLDPYIRQGTLQDDTFVYTDITSTSIPSTSHNMPNNTLKISGGSISIASDIVDDRIYDLQNNSVLITWQDSVNKYTLSGTIKYGDLSLYKTSTKYIFTCDINNGKITTTVIATNISTIDDIVNGNVSVIGNTTSRNIQLTQIDIMGTGSQLYLTEESTEFSNQVVAQDLYNYGKDVLNRMSKPSFSFDTDNVNFIFLKEYLPFIQNIALGDTVMLELPDERIIYPVFLELNMSYETETSFSIKFGNKFKLDSSVYDLMDIFDQSIKSGTNSSFERSNWSNYIDSGDKNEVYDMKYNMLDVATRGLGSSKDQEILINKNGMLVRQFIPATNTYDPKQLKITNGIIAFSNDAFLTAGLALGEMNGKFGVVADVLVGTLLAGENVIITNKSPAGKNIKFQVDGNGVLIENASLNMTTSNNAGKIILDPTLGIKIQGNQGGIWKDVFYVDNFGNGIFAGSLSAATGTIGGWQIGVGTLTSANGQIILNSSIPQIRCGATVIDSTGAISTSGNNTTVSSGGILTARGANFSGNISASSISGGSISGTTISGNTIIGGTISGTTISGTTINGGTIYGTTINGGFISGAEITFGGGNGSLYFDNGASELRMHCAMNMYMSSAGQYLIDGNSSISLSSSSGLISLYAPKLYFYNLPTTSTSANLYVDSGSSRVYRSTSSKKYKKNIQDLDENIIELIDYIRPVKYESINPDEAGKNYYGFIAEELYDLDKTLADFYIDKDGKIQVENANYIQLIPILVLKLKDIQKQINKIKEKDYKNGK